MDSLQPWLPESLQLQVEWLADQSFVGNTYLDYVQSLLITLSLILVFWFLKRFALWRARQLAAKTANDIDDLVVELAEGVYFSVIVIVALTLGLRTLSLGGTADQLAWASLIIALTSQVILLLQQIVDYVVERQLRYQEQKAEGEGNAELGGFTASASVLRNFGSLVKYTLWLLGALLVLSNLGFNVTSLLAGLGVGGIAVAFALQNILSDLFSSLAIYFDKPFQEGDFIVVGENMGTVEEIGIKSTRIRALSGEEVVVPNQELTNARIQNYKTMERRRVVLKFGVAYETPNGKLKKIPLAVEKMISGIESVTFDRAHLDALSDSSIDYEVVFHIEDSDYALFMDIKQQILIDLKGYLEKQGVTIPYPTRMVYTRQEGK